jgi:cytochrome d ubiquinol oxidase subunit I
MNYPLWDVPFLGGTWIIGLIASVHVFVSHFAVGGGAFFAITEQWAYKTGDQRIYDYLKKHSLFFLLLTTVFGAVTGVGIWWAISLVNPSGTATLIQTFTLGWAEEYLFFVAEIATIMVYYYTWDRISKEQHLNLARWYAFLSIMTLVIINGILTFMLTPGHWLQSRYWLEGFFNETYWPSLILRLLIMAALAGMYALVTASLIKDVDFRSKMLRYASKWFLPIFILGPVVGYWYFINIPQDALHNIMTGIQASGIGNFSVLARAIYMSLILSGTILLYAFVGPYLNAKGFSFHAAVMFLICGLLVTSISEWSREMLRKPYVIYGYMYSNGLIKEQVAELNQKGFTLNAKWVPKHLSQQQLGQKMFQYQCASCHTQHGYRSMHKLLGERDEEAITAFLQILRKTSPKENPYTGIMPPVIGTDEELKALSRYLYSEHHPETGSLAAKTTPLKAEANAQKPH